MLYDIVIVGGGPAGLTAALYARRANKSVLVIEKATFGGQITYSPKVENIPGVLAVSGNEFAECLVDQVVNSGAQVESAEVTAIRDGVTKTVLTDDNTAHQAKCVIIATGAHHRTLGVPGEERFIGNGVSFCAVCDGAFYADATVAVIGGGNSAMQEALLLSDLAAKVYIVQNLDILTGEPKLAEQIHERSNIELITGTTVDAVLGEEKLNGIRIRRAKDGAVSDLPIDGVFVAIGLVPQNEHFADILALDERGYALTDDSLAAKVRGVFVAGDCRRKKIRQVVTAVSDGAIAALSACEYLDSMA